MEEVGVGDVRRVPLPAVGDHPPDRRVGPDEVHDRSSRDALPKDVRNAPARDTVEVRPHLHLGEGEKLVPGELPGPLDGAKEAEPEPGKVRLGDGPDVVGNWGLDPSLAGRKGTARHGRTVPPARTPCNRGRFS